MKQESKVQTDLLNHQCELIVILETGLSSLTISMLVSALYFLS